MICDFHLTRLDEGDAHAAAHAAKQSSEDRDVAQDAASSDDA